MLDLDHIEASLARRFGIQHFRLVVGSVIYEYNLEDASMNMNVGEANKYQLELVRLS